MKVNKDKYGLVLAGGGGKGGYEIGVWKALRESKTLSIGAVSGTSVGALNAALYMTGDYDMAENIWLNITPDKILSPKQISAEDYITSVLLSMLSPYFTGPLSTVIYAGARGVGSLAGVGATALIKRYIRNRHGMFSREGLDKIIKDSGIIEKIDKDSIPCFATCFNVEKKRTQSFCLNTEYKDNIADILLASSAIPIVFPKQEINSEYYYDGGIPVVGDNVPVKPLYDLGYKKFIVVHLGRDDVESLTKRFKGATFIHVFPKKDIGGVVNGTLDFLPENARKRIELGYQDMKEQIDMLNNIDASMKYRNDNVEEIHIYSGKYYNTLGAILNNLGDTFSASQKPEDSDFRFDSLDEELSDLLNRFKQNSKEMDKFVLEGVTHISALDAQIDELHGSIGLKKLWNNINGKNNRLRKGIDNNIVDVQQATSKMIYKLVETDAMSIELIRTVQSQLQGATIKMGHILEEQGYEISDIKGKYIEIAHQYGELVLRDKKNAEEIDKIYKLFFENTKNLEFKFKNVEKDIESIKDVQRLQNWVINIKYHSFRQKDYEQLDVYEKLVCVASDFFYFTKGKWDDKLLLFVKSALDSLGISPYEIIYYNELIYKLILDKNLRDYLFERNGIKIYASSSMSENMPHYEAVVNGICIGEKAIDNEIDIELWIDKFLTDRTGGIELQGNTVFNIICEIFIIMKQFNDNMQNNEILPAYRDIKKEALLGNINAEFKYVNLLLEHNYIEQAFNIIEDMKTRVDDNPEFEKLKSRVLDAYLMYA